MLPIAFLRHKSLSDENVFRPEPDEVVNSITHAVGFGLSLIGAVVMAIIVLPRNDLPRTLACGTYVAALVTVYFCSTLSHSISDARWKRRFRMLDQAFIYLLIVGSYTPWVVYLPGGWWSGYTVLVWGVALLGFFSKLFFAHQIDSVAIRLYIALGWFLALPAIPLVHSVPVTSLWWMLYGGICYTIGAWFLVNDHRSDYFHAVWHVLVIIGSAWHYFAILIFVAMA